METPRIKDNLMKDFLFKRIGSLHVLLHKNFEDILPDKWWHDICCENYSNECLIKKGTYKSIFIQKFKENTFFIKKYKTKGFFNRIKSVFFDSRARKEFYAGVYIKSKGIAAPEPLFMAEAKQGLTGKESFIAMTFLKDAVELKDIYFKSPEIADRKKNMIAEEVGRLTGRVFAGGILQQDCSVNNFMVVEKAGDLVPVFIDFEKVKVNRKISVKKKTALLAKLNRVGREVSLKDRLRFLRGYLEVDGSIAPCLKVLALRVQENTVKILKNDIRRKRATSIYTHGDYNRIKRGRVWAIFRKGFSPDELIEKTGDIRGETKEINYIKNGNSGTKLPVLKFKPAEALNFWSAINVLTVAGLPVDMPLCIVHTPDSGFIAFPKDFFKKYKDFTLSKGRVKEFFCKNFLKELILLDRLKQRFQSEDS